MSNGELPMKSGTDFQRPRKDLTPNFGEHVTLPDPVSSNVRTNNSPTSAEKDLQWRHQDPNTRLRVPNELSFRAPNFPTRLNEKGVSMRTIQKLMGHRHIGTTALYL